ncbi:MAG: hypothetical protein P8M30_11305 [Planctomycetaceae bacterium]|nr:hypothetical protein [Planctomycetaceae bacterium]
MLKSLGSTMFIFGIGSILLNLIHVEFLLLMWVDLWGPEIGWAIRIGMIVVGALLWIFAPAAGE